MGNKVHFGLENVHVAPITTKDNVESYEDPIKINGAVNVNLSKEGNETTFYADNMLYYTTNQNNGYSGDIEVADFPQEVLSKLLGWGDTTDSKGMWIEYADKEPVPFALMFEVSGAENNAESLARYVLYNCVVARPDLAAETLGEDKEPKTQTLSITATPKTFTINNVERKVVKGCLEKANAVGTSWDEFFKAVLEPTVSGA